jgi:hypothetical protein
MSISSVSGRGEPSHSVFVHDHLVDGKMAIDEELRGGIKAGTEYGHLFSAMHTALVRCNFGYLDLGEI